jgi:hypothetical protein
MHTLKLKPDPALVKAAKIATFNEQEDDFWKQAKEAQEQIDAKQANDDQQVQPRRLRK